MKRKVILSRGAYLWEAGDAARTFAVLEAGKLGVRVGADELVGIVYPGMVLGESAISQLEGPTLPRSAAIYALDDDTVVVEYPARLVKQLFDESTHAVPRAILMTLIGQICRNCLILMTAHKHNPFVSTPFKNLMQSLVQTYKTQIASVQRWEEFISAFRFLFATRDYTESMRNKLTVADAHRDAIQRASEVTREFFKDQEDLAFLNDFLNAEKERASFLDKPFGEAEKQPESAPPEHS